MSDILIEAHRKITSIVLPKLGQRGKLEMEQVSRRYPRFSLPLFSLTIGISFIGFLVALSVLVPEVWKAQISASSWKILIVFVVVHLVNGSFLELFFHRYFLHAPLFIRYPYERHDGTHHYLTRVIRKRRTGLSLVGSDQEFVVENRYPISNEGQYPASFFPWHSFLIFGGLLSIPFAFVQWLAPTWPIFLGGLLALLWSLFLYETIHAIEHDPRLEKMALRPNSWRLLKKFYAFHLRHHADPYSNEAVSGFFGLPVGDWLFGTYVKPSGLYEDGSVADARDFESPIPRFAFMRWLDALAEEKITRREGN